MLCCEVSPFISYSLGHPIALHISLRQPIISDDRIEFTTGESIILRNALDGMVWCCLASCFLSTEVKEGEIGIDEVRSAS